MNKIKNKTKKRISKRSKIIIWVVAGALFLSTSIWFLVATSTVGLFAGWAGGGGGGLMLTFPSPRHPRHWGRRIERDDYTIFAYAFRNGASILSINDASLVEDGVLTLPTRVGGHNIIEAGSSSLGVSFITGRGVHKIIVPARINIGTHFWSMGPGDRGRNEVRYVEFLCNTFNNAHDMWGGRFTLIIPDGSSEKFIYRLEYLRETLTRFTFIERSQWLETQNKEN